MLADLIALEIIPQDDGPAPTDDFAQFLAVFPSFAGLSEDVYDFWRDQALLVTEPFAACLGARFPLATWLLTAHYLTLQGLGSGAEAEMAANGASGFRSLKSGSLQIERYDRASAVDKSMGEYAETQYGRRLWPMLRSCLTGPRVTATGTIPCGCGGYRSGPLPWQ